MLELMLPRPRSVPAPVPAPAPAPVSSLPANYSPGDAFSFYKDPNSASPSSSWLIRQLLRLPLLFRSCWGRRLREAVVRVPFRSAPALLQLFCRCLSLETVVPSLCGLTPGAACRLPQAPPKGAGAQSIQPVSRLLSGKPLLQPGRVSTPRPPSARTTSPGLPLSPRRGPFQAVPRSPRWAPPSLPSFLCSASPPPQKGESPAGPTLHPDWRRLLRTACREM
ncbi:uncharacterized protein PS065_020101 [Dugong dugon]